ncbi:alpha/beta hydrolase [Ornithinibacillus sp. 4-3]|uniref:Alpha/beta hydrolase n=1 Tax=Ornithinibacillus sp. 4-3 TaxID=3231488 RepID=A0AB39HQK4_9BACI
MLPIAKESVYGCEAENLKMWGVDPQLGERFVNGLSDEFKVLYFDYEGHLLRNPNPDHLTPENIVRDFLLIADEMGVDHFSYYGYSWLALSGLQLAIRTDRLESLIMGGFPPLDGPYEEMLVVTNKTYEQSISNQNTYDYSNFTDSENKTPDEFDWENVEIKMNPGQTKQFVTLYQNLVNFNDQSIQILLTIPRLSFVGEKDTIVYGDNFGGVTVDIVGLIERNKKELGQLGWDVEVLQGEEMDHTKAMQPDYVLPLIKEWLSKHLA